MCLKVQIYNVTEKVQPALKEIEQEKERASAPHDATVTVR
jgi:hypothetical protein